MRTVSKKSVSAAETRNKESKLMDIFSVITLLGGLAFFLYGMNV